MPPADLRCHTILHEGRPLWVVSFALPRTPATDLGRLTPAMREVARLALEGASTAEIAARRGTSARTVGKQLESIYERLGVGSRSELAARFGTALAGVHP